jgi:hypothetical protein
MDEFAQALKNPSFMAHADQTIANGGPGTSYAYTKGAISQVQSPPYGIDRQSVPQPVSAPTPAYQYMNPQPAAYPVLPASPVTLKPKPARAIPDYRPLPSPVSQGCLWGLVQGVLAAFIVLIMKKDVFFYVAIVEGFLFFMLAGFLTTRKGGRTSRGAWAGFWAGIVSTVIFWIVVAVGFAVLVSQYIALQTARAQQSGTAQDPGTELHSAYTVVWATLPIHPAAPQPGTSVAVFLIGGLLCAIGFGLVGGILGKARFRAKMQRRGYP